MSLAFDFKADNFQVPNPDNTAFSRLTYRVSLGLPGTTAYTMASSDQIVIDLPSGTRPAVGDYLILASPRLNGEVGGRIAGVLDSRGGAAHGNVTLTLEGTIEALSGKTDAVEAMQVAMIQSERAYAIATVEGSDAFVSYETYPGGNAKVLARPVVRDQFPFSR
ncbi:MAG: hypothetical protein FJ382_12130 [Verrucomicrobia bacterium]|nr:hypothetical protein [Verrucomicrobiota bacterium]